MLPVLPLSILLLLVFAAAPSLQCSLFGGHRRPSTPYQTPEKLIFVLAGQSNMAGRGGVTDDHWDGVVPPESLPSPSILRFNARLQWEEASEPLHADIDVNKTCGVGPGMAFAHALLSSSSSYSAGMVVGLVPCAVGGTRIAEWARRTSLYGSLVRRTRAAVASGGGRVAAVMWYQGESDTVVLQDAEAYKGRMEAFIRDIRSDLGLPGLLVIQVVLASGEGNFTEIVRNAQKGIKLPNVRCVDAKGLQLGVDRLHLTTQAQVQLGKIMAAAYLNFAHCQPKL